MRFVESENQILAAVCTLLLGLGLALAPCYPAGAQIPRRHGLLSRSIPPPVAAPHDPSPAGQEDTDLRNDIVRQAAKSGVDGDGESSNRENSAALARTPANRPSFESPRWNLGSGK